MTEPTIGFTKELESIIGEIIISISRLPNKNRLISDLERGDFQSLFELSGIIDNYIDRLEPTDSLSLVDTQSLVLYMSSEVFVERLINRLAESINKEET